MAAGTTRNRCWACCFTVRLAAVRRRQHWFNGEAVPRAEGGLATVTPRAVDLFITAFVGAIFTAIPAGGR